MYLSDAQPQRTNIYSRISLETLGYSSYKEVLQAYVSNIESLETVIIRR